MKGKEFHKTGTHHTDILMQYAQRTEKGSLSSAKIQKTTKKKM